MRTGLKAKLASGTTTIGTWITLSSPAIAEIFARAGFDWVVIDLEHSAIGNAEAAEMIRVLDLAGIPPLVRLTGHNTDQVKRLMDAGAHGILIPDVRTPEEAKSAVQAVHYLPRGTRGVGLARAQGYGEAFDKYREWLESEAVVVVMIEHSEAVKRAEEILRVPGVDAFFLGPYDLSASLGVPGQLKHPDVVEAIERVRVAAKKCGRFGGLHQVDPQPEELRRWVKAGFTFMAYATDFGFLTRGAAAGVASMRGEVGHDA